MVAKVFTRRITPPGGTDPVWVLDHEQCTRLVMSGCLKSANADKLGEDILQQFARLRGGDQSLHAEIDENAASNSLEAQMARTAAGLPAAAVPTAVIVQPETALITNDVQKKRRFDAETAKMEAETQAMALDNETKALDNKKKRVETLTATKLGYETLLGGPAMEDRDRMLLNDMIRAEIFGQPRGQHQQKLLTDGTSNDDNNEEFTADKLILGAGYKPTQGLRTGLGRVLAAKFRSLYPGKEPPSCKRWIDGRMTDDVKYYYAKDKAWLLDETARYCAAHSNDPAPGQQTLVGFVVR